MTNLIIQKLLKNNMEDLYLIYVHQVGFTHDSSNIYQFIFSDTIVGVDGDGWDSYPSSGNPYPPFDKFKNQVGEIMSEIKLTLLQDNEQFSMWDGVDGVVALGWQNIDGMEEYPENRITFPFGMKIKDVEALLYESDIIMKYEKKLSDE
jgi:hypothetical protein